MWLRYLAFLCLASACWADDCILTPIAMPITNVTLATGLIARGINASVGTPPQNLAFMPRWINNTFAFGTNGHCSSGLGYDTDGCITYRGGYYDMLESTTQADADEDSYFSDISPYTNISIYSDTLVLGSDINITDFPIAIANSDMGGTYWPMNTMGIAFNSTVLSALRSAGKIASRSWSMFWGLDGTNEQMDGIFVLGGYDKAKIQGDGYTQNINPTDTCATGMVLSITDMILNFANGTDSSIFSDNSFAALQVCLQPDFPALMTIPYDPYFKNVQTLMNVTLETRSSGMLFYTMRYDTGEPVYTGDLTMKFQSGLSVRIPNDRLILPDRHIADNGTIVIEEPQTTIFNSNQGVNADDLSILGRLFLSSAYLHCNEEAGRFTLWPINATTDSDLVAVDSNNAEVTSCSTTSGTVVASSSASSVSSSDSDSTTTSTGASASTVSKLSSGSIAGIAVGSVAGVALVVGAALFWLRRGRRKPPVIIKPELPNNVYNPYGDGRVPKEILAVGGYPQEMPAHYVGELPAEYLREMSAESAMAARNQLYTTPKPILHQERFELMG